MGQSTRRVATAAHGSVPVQPATSTMAVSVIEGGNVVGAGDFSLEEDAARIDNGRLKLVTSRRQCHWVVAQLYPTSVGGMVIFWPDKLYAHPMGSFQLRDTLISRARRITGAGKEPSTPITASPSARPGGAPLPSSGCPVWRKNDICRPIFSPHFPVNISSVYMLPVMSVVSGFK